MGSCLLELLMNKLMIYISITCAGKYKIYIDKFCKLNASRLKIGAIKKILKEGYDIVAKRKIIPGY